MAAKWLALRGAFTAGSWQALNGRQMATLKRAICDKKWLAMLPFLPFVALTETTNGPFMACLLGMLLIKGQMTTSRNKKCRSNFEIVITQNCQFFELECPTKAENVGDSMVYIGILLNFQYMVCFKRSPQPQNGCHLENLKIIAN